MSSPYTKLSDRGILVRDATGSLVFVSMLYNNPPAPSDGEFGIEVNHAGPGRAFIPIKALPGFDIYTYQSDGFGTTFAGYDMPDNTKVALRSDGESRECYIALNRGFSADSTNLYSYMHLNMGSGDGFMTKAGNYTYDIGTGRFSIGTMRLAIHAIYTETDWDSVTWATRPLGSQVSVSDISITTLGIANDDLDGFGVSTYSNVNYNADVFRLTAGGSFIGWGYNDWYGIRLVLTHSLSSSYDNWSACAFSSANLIGMYRYV